MIESTLLAACPSWCSGGHIPVDGSGIIHISVDQAVELTSGSERRTAYVSLEQVNDGQAAVRLEGVASAPMGTAQALLLARVLTAAAFAAVTGEQVTR